MHRLVHRSILLTATLAASIALAACTGAAATPAPTAIAALPAAATDSAMASHAAMASESAMASHAAMASESAMASHSAMPSESAIASGGPRTVAMGKFHAVDGSAKGTAALIHLADGSFEVTFEDFSTQSAAHTDVILVMNADVTRTSDIDQKAFLDLGPLKATTGMQDFVVPAAMAAGAMSYQTVVLWDSQMVHAVAAAPLMP